MSGLVTYYKLAVHKRAQEEKHGTANYLGETEMLVLTRRINESIVIGDNIKITILDIRGNHIRLGIDAPRHIPVHRSEVQSRIAANSMPVLGTS